MTRVSGTMDSAPETLAGISVDAVRELLAQLGHDDVSDEVIREFLKQLTADAAFLEEPAVPHRAAPAPARPRRAARTTASAAKARAASAEGASARETAREAPEPMRVPTSPRRTPRTEEAKKKAPSVVVAPAPRGAARRGAVARGADGAPIPVAASAFSPRTPSAASSTPRRDASTPIRSTFGSAPRFARDPLGPAGAARPRSARPSSPTRTRVVAASERGASRRIDSEPSPNRTKSVIRAAIPAARGATPGQYRVTDRVARAARYSDAWREDAFLRNAELRTDARARAAVVPRRPQNFAAAFARAQARSDANVERAKREARAARGEKLSREDWERYFELSRRARVKLTDAGDARDEGRGFFTKKKTSPSPVAAGGTTRESKPRGRSPREFTPPCDKRRDDVRWEVRRRMAAPPVLSR